MSSKYGPKLGHPKIAHHSNPELQPEFNSSKLGSTAKTIVWTVLNQVVFFQSKLWPFLSNEQFLDDLNLTEAP